MNKINNKHFTGERDLFKQADTIITNCLFDDGESPLKESRNLKIENCTFGWKYPLWYGDNHVVKSSKFMEMARSGIWYTNNSTFDNLDLIAPKLFRRCNNITLSNLYFHEAKETLWTCTNVKMQNIKAEQGDYFGKDSTDVLIDNLKLDGNYCFDGGKNIHISNSLLNSKDAFWNCENILIENCTIIGEYFGWNSKNITLINCTISSHQGFCYIDGLTLKNCKITDSDLIFEYCSNIQAEITSGLDSVKNPISGFIKAKSIKELIQDDEGIDLKNIQIITADN